MPRKNKMEPLNADLFLRSINLPFDADHPERVSHFRPTTKCVALIRAIVGHEDERAFFLVAPYGSGKSLTSSYVLHQIENQRKSSDILRGINKRLSAVSPDLAAEANKRRLKSNKRGITITLHGYTTNLVEQIKQSALASIKRIGLARNAKSIISIETNDPIVLLNAIKEFSIKNKCDHVAFIWDEFGRHLESLVAEGRGNELDDIQSIAEYVSRTQKIKMTFCLILHQGLLHHASGIPQTMRTDWKKIEGRFQTIQYVDDSKEIYRLISEVVASRRLGECDQKSVTGKAKQCRDLGIFTEFKSRELNELIKAAYPLEPLTLYLLPRVSSRVAQNERTLFNFLCTRDLKTSVTPAGLYDYFSPVMRSDTAVGGTHRQWLETESAITKIPSDDPGAAILKTACLLGLGTSGERSRASRPLLEFASKGYGTVSLAKPMKQLLEKKLLLHRKHNDDISIWHGTDVDLRGRLAEERGKLSKHFDLVNYLTKETPPPVWKPVEYNDDFCIRRFLTGKYGAISKDGLLTNCDPLFEELPLGEDGRIVFLLANDEDELKQAEKLAVEFADEKRLVIAMPIEPVPLFEAAVEVATLQQMQLDSELLDSDPLALAELQQMTDDAFIHLLRLIDRMVMPSPDGPRWFHDKKEFIANSPKQLRHELSNIMRKVYPATPRLNNETINKNRPSGSLVNSRKKLELAVLERHGQAGLGIQGYFPDKSMFNTLLLHTGLYRKDKRSKSWAYCHSNSIKDNDGLKKVWQKLQKFFTVPTARSMSFTELLDELKSPPFGMRSGVLPIFIAAALRAYPSAISLLHKGEYVTDILPSTIEDLCKTPENYVVTVLDIDKPKQQLLTACHNYFSAAAHYEIEENDLVRLTYDALEAWKHQLPPAAFTSQQISKESAQFRIAILHTTDPVRLFFTDIPKALGKSIFKPKSLMLAIKKCCAELQEVAEVYYKQAERSLREHLSAEGTNLNSGVCEIAKTWSSYFPEAFVDSLDDKGTKAFLSRLNDDFDSDRKFIDSLASYLVGKRVPKWDDSIITNFDRLLSNYVHKIENVALNYPNQDKALRSGLRRLLVDRVSDLYVQLETVVGKDEAADILNQIRTSKDSKANAHNAGSYRESVK